MIADGKDEPDAFDQDEKRQQEADQPHYQKRDPQHGFRSIAVAWQVNAGRRTMIQQPSPQLLTVLFVVLCILDIWSTAKAIKAGGREMMPGGLLFKPLGVVGGGLLLKIVGGAVVLWGIWAAPQYGIYFAALIFVGIGVVGFNLFNAAD